MILSAAIYIVVLALLKFVKVGPGAALYGSWPLLPGLLLGTQFIWIDRWVISYLRSRGFLSEDRLLTQNILFAYGWIVVAFFGLTSTVSLFGKGFVMGIGLQLAHAGLGSPDFFWPIKRQLSGKEQKWAIGIFLMVFGLFTFMV